MRVYMMVTADEYETPLIVTDTLEEMSKLSGVSVGGIASSMKKGCRGQRNGRKFIRIDIEDEEKEKQDDYL